MPCICRLPYIYMEYTWYIPTVYLIGVPDGSFRNQDSLSVLLVEGLLEEDFFNSIEVSLAGLGFNLNDIILKIKFKFPGTVMSIIQVRSLSHCDITCDITHF